MRHIVKFVIIGGLLGSLGYGLYNYYARKKEDFSDKPTPPFIRGRRATAEDGQRILLGRAMKRRVSRSPRKRTLIREPIKLRELPLPGREERKQCLIQQYYERHRN